MSRNKMMKMMRPIRTLLFACVCYYFTVFFNNPIPSIDMDTVSPGIRCFGGLKPDPTPAPPSIQSVSKTSNMVLAISCPFCFHVGAIIPQKYAGSIYPYTGGHSASGKSCFY